MPGSGGPPDLAFGISGITMALADADSLSSVVYEQSEARECVHAEFRGHHLVLNSKRGGNEVTGGTGFISRIWNGRALQAFHN